MTYTVEQRDQLKAAIAKGVLELQMGQERVRFDDVKGMQQRLALIEAELSAAGASRGSRHYPATSRG